MSAPSLPISALVGLCLTAFTLPASAVTVAYYQLDGTVGATVGTAAGSVPADAGTASGAGVSVSSGTLPAYAAGTPGTIITAGVGGAPVNASNTASLSFSTTNNTNTGGRVNLPAVGTTIYQPASFTIEAFINTTQTGSFSNLFSYSRADGNGATWMLDTNSNGTLRARFDTQALGTSGPTAPGFNQNITTTGAINDGAWHHVAMTYDAATRQILIYRDYVQVGSAIATNALVYDNSAAGFGAGGGGQGYNGLMDEVRLSNAVLGTNDFLRAIPEPTTAFLSALGLLGLLRRKRG